MDSSIFCGGIPALMTPANADHTPNTAGLAKKGQDLIAAGMNAAAPKNDASMMSEPRTLVKPASDARPDGPEIANGLALYYIYI